MHPLPGEGHASITWRGTWNIRLSPRVVEAWQWLAEHHFCGAIQVRNQ